MEAPILKILGSSSKGNGYIIKTSTDSLIIECGVNVPHALKALDFDIKDCRGAIVTHEHKDHAGYIKAYSRYTTIYSNATVAEKFGNTTILAEKVRHTLGRFTIIPLSVEHNADNYAYIVSHPEIGNIVFATDCIDFPYHVKDVTTLMIECNYSSQILEAKAMAGEEIRSRYQHHMEINTALSIIKSHLSPSLQRVILLHLSDSLSDEKAFVQSVKDIVGGIDVYAANDNIEISLNLFEF